MWLKGISAAELSSSICVKASKGEVKPPNTKDHIMKTSRRRDVNRWSEADLQGKQTLFPDIKAQWVHDLWTCLWPENPKLMPSVCSHYSELQTSKVMASRLSSSSETMAEAGKGHRSRGGLAWNQMNKMIIKPNKNRDRGNKILKQLQKCKTTAKRPQTLQMQTIFPQHILV